MEKKQLRWPFFVVNPKSYLYGEDILKLAKYTDKLAEKYDFDVLFTAQLIDLPRIIDECPHLVPCAQYMESLKPGRGMGHVLPEALAAAGVKATFPTMPRTPLPCMSWQLPSLAPTRLASLPSCAPIPSRRAR